MRFIVIPLAYWTPRVLLYRWTNHDSFWYFALPHAAVTAVAFLLERRWPSRLPASVWGAGSTLAILAMTPAFLLLRDNTLGDPIARLYFRRRLSFIVRGLGVTDAPFFLGLLVAGILVWLATASARGRARGRRFASPARRC